jgi:hypothetical protein
MVRMGTLTAHTDFGHDTDHRFKVLAGSCKDIVSKNRRVVTCDMEQTLDSMYNSTYWYTVDWHTYLLYQMLRRNVRDLDRYVHTPELK